MLAYPTQPTQTLDARTAVGYLIAASGNASLAASRASIDFDTKITDAFLLATIAADPSGINMLFSQVKVLAILSALDTFRMMQLAMTQQIPALSAKDTAKTYTSLLDSLGRLSAHSTMEKIDPLRAVLDALPAEAAEAVQFFLQNPDAAASGLTPQPATTSTSTGAPPNPPVTMREAQPAYRTGRDVTRDVE